MCPSASESSRHAGSSCSPPLRPPVSAPRTSLTRPSRSSTRRPCNRVTSWASAYTPATRCEATKSAGWSASAGRPSSSAASTPPSTRRSRPSWAGPTRWSRATATWPGGRRWTTSPPAPCSRSTRAGGSTPSTFKAARWDLLPDGSYMWASVQTIRGCPKHCSFCSVWRTDGQQPRQRHVDVVVDEIVELRRKGYRFIALADDNFYPVSQEDLRMARRRADPTRLHELEAIRAERFELMERLAELPRDMVFFTQITMEAAEDTAFLDAMRNANIKGALVGVEAVTPGGPEGRLQGLQRRRRGAGRAPADVPHARRARPRLVHLRPAERSAVDVRSDRGPGPAGRRHLRPVRDADAVPGHPRLQQVGRDARAGAGEVRRHSGQPPLADPAGAAPQGLHAAPGDGRRGDPRAHPGRVGQVLQPGLDLAALDLRQVATSRGWPSC